MTVMTSQSTSLILATPLLSKKPKHLSDSDLIRSYLRDIGRVPLLSNEQEITLGRQVQDLMALENYEKQFISNNGVKPSFQELADFIGITVPVLKRKMRLGERAKERMVSANLRLVVSVAKKYTKRNIELLGQVPLSAELRESSDSGIPMMISNPKSIQSEAFENVSKKLIELLEM